ncbi:MAG: hypothetical protein IAX21_06680 [Candidatus Bathyarchaeota archaeon]|nr:hypothetical protein [Candidatus Bathyarchaeum tardum]WGM89370.1 MAG: hypothetical protein NUK63_10775 [Candidatus Bathyarchaeum tardum]WNZ28355.1 MAG: hypothetical protein IAX21_06680 [Candidatus Bathyarchaeota archaeon]
MKLNVKHIWVFAFISDMLAIYFAFNQELIGVIGFTSLYIALLASTKWVNIEKTRNNLEAVMG